MEHFRPLKSLFLRPTREKSEVKHHLLITNKIFHTNTIIVKYKKFLLLVIVELRMI